MNVHLSSCNSVKYSTPNLTLSPTITQILNPNTKLNHNANSNKISIINSTALCITVAPFYESICICTVTHSDRRSKNFCKKLITSDQLSERCVKIYMFRLLIWTYNCRFIIPSKILSYHRELGTCLNKDWCDIFTVIFSLYCNSCIMQFFITSTVFHDMVCLNSLVDILQGRQAQTLAPLPTQSFCKTVESQMMVFGNENFYSPFLMVYLLFFSCFNFKKNLQILTIWVKSIKCWIEAVYIHNSMPVTKVKIHIYWLCKFLDNIVECQQIMRKLYWWPFASSVWFGSANGLTHDQAPQKCCRYHWLGLSYCLLRKQHCQSTVDKYNLLMCRLIVNGMNIYIFFINIFTDQCA